MKQPLINSPPLSKPLFGSKHQCECPRNIYTIIIHCILKLHVRMVIMAGGTVHCAVKLCLAHLPCPQISEMTFVRDILSLSTGMMSKSNVAKNVLQISLIIRYNLKCNVSDLRPAICPSPCLSVSIYYTKTHFENIRYARGTEVQFRPPLVSSCSPNTCRLGALQT